MVRKRNLLAEKIENLNRYRKIITLAWKLDNDGLRVAEIIELISGLSRLDRILLYNYLSPRSCEKYGWALQKIKTKRRSILISACNNSSVEAFPSNFGWLEKLELISGKLDEIDRIIKKNIRAEFVENGLTEDFIDVVKAIKNGDSENVSVKNLVDNFSKAEKDAVLEIFSEVVLGGNQFNILKELKNRLTLYALGGEFPSGEFILELVERLVTEYITVHYGIDEGDYYVYSENEKEDINMNPKSPSLITNSLLATTTGAAYLISLINFFQYSSKVDEKDFIDVMAGSIGKS